MPQYALRSPPSRIQSEAKRSFFLSKRSTSYASRPNARTTRTPVRFSCTVADSSPSASSAVRKRFAIFE